MAQQQSRPDGVGTWLLIAAGCVGIFGALIWLMLSHMIVYYFTPVFDKLGFLWRILPFGLGSSQTAQMDFNYVLFRRHPAHIPFMDWVRYINLTLKPWVFVFIPFATWMFVRQSKYIKKGRLNEKMTPESLATQMMQVFTDIAPVVKLQKDLVADKLSRWRRQVFPHEFIEKARYQGKKVLVRDPKRGGLKVDAGRLDGYLRTVKPYRHGKLSLIHSKFLGRQIVDLRNDAKVLPAFPDRLSDAGKAIFAILAPYAFNSGKEKEQSKRVADALNLSAYGAPQGMPNLSLPVVAESFEQWRNYALAKKIAKIHHWENTYLFALLEHAQRSGKIGTWNFIWLKPTDRILFYVLNSVGRKTPHSEAALAFSQHQFEHRAAKMGRLPVTPDIKPVIFTSNVVHSFINEWEFWRTAEDDNNDWWKEEGLLDWDQNELLMQALGINTEMPPTDAK